MIFRGAITDYQEYLRLNTDKNSPEWQEVQQVIRDLQELLQSNLSTPFQP